MINSVCLLGASKSIPLQKLQFFWKWINVT